MNGRAGRADRTEVQRRVLVHQQVLYNLRTQVEAVTEVGRPGIERLLGRYRTARAVRLTIRIAEAELARLLEHVGVPA